MSRRLWNFGRFLLILVLRLELGYCRSLWNADTPEIVLPSYPLDSDESLSGEVQVYRKGPQARTVLRTTYWEDGVVPYRFDVNYLPEDVDLIKSGMKEIQDQSCVKFVPWQKGIKDYIMIRNLQTCASHIGKIGNRQGVSLGVRCLSKPTVVHELMHTLGFAHEHSRPDRDDYIMIVEDNILDEYKHNFDKYEDDQVSSMGQKYDINSIMHYDAYAYTKDPEKPTIVSLNPDLAVGTQGKLSDADIWKLNKLYKCNS